MPRGYPSATDRGRHHEDAIPLAQLRALVQRLQILLPWKGAAEVTFECEPGTLKKSKLETIRSIGTTRLSLGIEHFDDEVLAVGGRAHRSPEVFQAYEWAREVGFPQINIDLIAGMVGVANGHSTITPCNSGLQKLADAAIEAAKAGGFKGMVLNHDSPNFSAWP